MNLTLFSAQPYDHIYFTPAAEKAGIAIRYEEMPLNETTAALVTETQAVCVFVNDQVNENVCAKLSAAGVRIPGFSAILILLCGPVFGVMSAHKKLTKVATEARRSFSYALSSYLDLVNVLLAGGAGSETALIAAAQTGDNWAFEMIRSALDRARAERITQWTALGELASLINVSDLTRVAGSMQLAGEQGSRVRASLAAQADAVRSRQMNEIEAAAQSATERMGVPTVLLFMGFIALLGYPALELVMGSM